MLNVLYKSDISPVDVIVRTNYIKRTLLPSEGLAWTDLMVLCTLIKLEEEGIMNTTSDVNARLRMNKCWVYRSIRKLQTKNLIKVTYRPQAASYLCTSGWGKILLQRVDECLRGIDPYS